MTRRQAIIAEARRWIGTPYRQGASLHGVGCDCIGLVRGVWRACCGPEPIRRPVYDMPPDDAVLTDTLSRFCQQRPIAERQCGDILVFRWRVSTWSAHCAIQSGPASMVHCHANRAVCETALASWWTRRLAGVFTFPESEALWDS